MWTLVGSGHKKFTDTCMPMSQAIPKGANWIKDSVAEVQPDKNLVITAGGLEVLSYNKKFCQNSLKCN